MPTNGYAQPANDQCDNATVLNVGTSASYDGSYTLVDATLSANLPYSVCSQEPKREVWFKALVPAEGILVIQSETNTNPNITMTAYSGTCNSLTYETCTKELEPGKGYLQMALSADNISNLNNNEIYIRVDRGNSNKKDDFKICAFKQDRPVNESCATAIALSNEDGTFEHTSYTNKFGVSSAEAGPSCGSFLGGDVWFETVMPTTGKLVVNAKSSEMKPVLALYTGVCGGLVYQTCATTTGTNTEIIFNDVSLAEEVIYIRVYADGNPTGGNFDLLVLEPTQDICAEARMLDGIKSEESFAKYTNKYATDSGTAEPACAYLGKDIWFTMDVPASGELIIDSKPSDDLSIKPVLTVYSGTCTALTQVACNMFGSSTPFGGKVSIIPADNLANQTVYLRMHNYNSTVGGAFDLSVHNPSAALPVDLIYFTANAFNSEVILDWATATEDNNDYFLIERSVDGESFIPIDKVKGHGTTSELQQYTYVDTNPFYGHNYYRLKQVDLDGAFEYFDIVVANVRLTEEQFKLFPNPGYTKDVITLRWSEDLGAEKLEVAITDALGRQIYRQGINDHYERETSINCGGLNLDAGIYFLQLSTEKHVIAHRRFSLIVD